MKRMFFIVVFIMLVFPGCFKTPDLSVVIIGTNPLGWVADSSGGVYGTYDENGKLVPWAMIDSITLLSENNVDVRLKGFYVEFWYWDSIGESTLVRTSPIYILGGTIFGSSPQDTFLFTVYNIPIPCSSAVAYLYADSRRGSICARVHLFGDDLFGYNKRFDIFQDYGLIKVHLK